MISPRREKQLLDLEKKIGVTFLSKALLNQSLTHSSYAYESREKISDNERLEFLGDAVLKLVVSEYLFHKFPERQEGDLTKIRASVISDVTLASVAQRMGIGSFILLGANEKRTGGADRKSNLANSFEALLGAVYLDGGIGKSREMVLRFLTGEIDKVSKEGYIRDFKSALQEFVQKKGWGLPLYRVVNEAGPRHRRIFLMEVVIKGKSMGVGKGPSKKESEQAAAKIALSKVQKNKNSTTHKLISAVKRGINFKRRKPQ
ncbi:ribonuclease III [Candidatus Margulisiibacteriota bacterium]